MRGYIVLHGIQFCCSWCGFVGKTMCDQICIVCEGGLVVQTKGSIVATSGVTSSSTTEGVLLLQQMKSQRLTNEVTRVNKWSPGVNKWSHKGLLRSCWLSLSKLLYHDLISRCECYARVVTCLLLFICYSEGPYSCLLDQEETFKKHEVYLNIMVPLCAVDEYIMCYYRSAMTRAV